MRVAEASFHLERNKTSFEAFIQTYRVQGGENRKWLGHVAPTARGAVGKPVGMPRTSCRGGGGPPGGSFEAEEAGGCWAVGAGSDTVRRWWQWSSREVAAKQPAGRW